MASVRTIQNNGVVRFGVQTQRRPSLNAIERNRKFSAATFRHRHVFVLLLWLFPRKEMRQTGS